jgi:agmatine deiminase
MLAPSDYKYYMPPEWQKHQATLLTWPHNRNTWPSELMPAVESAFIDMVAAITEGGAEKVFININDEQETQRLRNLFKDKGISQEGVQFFVIASNDAWCRDHGPIFTIDPQNKENPMAILNWEYNAWGRKYSPYDDDNLIPLKIAEKMGIPVFSPGIVLEGGSIDVNGEGCLLTSKSCLLNPNRNPGLNQQEIEAYLKSYLGVEKILWLEEGIIGDDTDGHIDDMARFTSPNAIVYAIEENPEDENYKVLRRNLELLQTFTDVSGRPFQLTPIPMPRPLYHKGVRLPASYLNFYIANSAVLTPVFGDKQTESIALGVLQEAFPSRKVVGIDCKALVWGLGALHCVTQQIPE